MAEQNTRTIKTRIINKHATAAVWNNTDFIPLQGEVIVYDKDVDYPYERTKIGDGTRTISELPFTHEAGGYNTVASGKYSRAEGNETIAAGVTSHAEGEFSIAKGHMAHVEGRGLQARDYSVEFLGKTYSLATLGLKIASVDTENKTITTTKINNILVTEDVINSMLGKISTGRFVLKTAPAGQTTYSYTPIKGYSVQGSLANYYLVFTVSDIYNEELDGSLSNITNYDIKDVCLGVSYGEASHIEGYGNIAFADYTHAEGMLNAAEGLGSHVEGRYTITTGEYAHAEGASTRALGNFTHAEGHGTKATADEAHAEGIGAIASGVGSHAEGYYTEASHEYAHVEGRAAVASGKISHAEGHATVAFGSVSHAEGNGTAANGNNSHAEGHSTVAEGETSHAEGIGTKAQGKGSHAEGENTTAAANRAHAEGYGTSANELNSHAEGKLTTASAEEAHAEGISTVASGAYSHAEGEITQALSEAAHAEGKETVAQGIGAHAEGSKSKALNNMAHAEGSNTEASGEKSHSEGNSTKATGTASHAEGDKTEAKGYASHAGGQNSIASNAGSFVHGTGLKTNSNNQFVVGAYNKTFNDAGAAAFIVGNGKEDARSNALAVMKSGDAYLKGDLYVGGLPEGDEGTGIAKVATEDEAHLYAETVANSAAEQVKNELLNGAGDAYDTLKELGDLIDENKDAFEVVTDLVNNKADQNDVSNAFKKTVSTTAGRQFLTITDHSPVPHMMRLIGKHNLYSSEVHQYGKNILNMESFLGGALVQTTDGTYDLRYSNGNTYVSAWNHQYIPADTVITISLEVLDYVDIADGNVKLQIQTSGGNHWLDFPVSTIGRQSKTITTKGDVNQMQFMIASSNGKSAGIVFKEPQFELGATATEYVAYQTAYYDAPATGVDVPAFYPVTTFITDWGLIDCTYNQDINNIFDDTNYMSATDPVGTGSFSMNRKAGTTVGVYSHAEGNNTTASGRSSHAEGNSTTASNIGAHAEGSATVASGLDSHAEGQNTTASGQDAHAEGYYTFAEELGAHAGGLYSHAKTKGSFAHGQRVTADADYQATFGTHNEVNTNAAFIVGNGANINSKNNAFEVQKDGNAFVKGDLYIGGTGSTQASAKQVATKDSISAMEQRINNLEDITSSTGGVFFEDADVAYVKTIPENIAPYASLNKVGGLGIYKKKLVNLIPSTYETANETKIGDHTFRSDSEGVITIIDRTPVEEWTSEPWFSGEFSLNTIELPAGTYTAAIYADNPEGSPFGLRIWGVGMGELYVGGAWGYDYLESPATFALTETTTIQVSLSFQCGGSAWVPSGDLEICRFRVMLNEGDEAMPWEPYSETPPVYVEPAKVSSIDIIGKNLLDYGESRTVENGSPGEAETHFIIKDDGMCYIATHYIPVEVGPGSEYTEVFNIPIDQINSSIIYPAGTYSVGEDVPCNVWSGGVAYLMLYARTTTGQSFIIRGNNNKINESFNVIGAAIEYAPEQLTSSVYGIEVPLMLVKGAEAPTGPIAFKCDTIQIPQSILSRDDYGLGVNDGTEIYTNYIDFERQVYVKRCLSIDLEDQMTYINISGTKINVTTLWQTIQCSHPGFTFDIYSDGPGSRTLYALRNGSTEGVSEYITQAASEGNPVKVFFGTNLTEEIDISADLIGIDNYIPVEAGGLIYFNNDQQIAVPSTIEYQAMMKEGETE